MPRARDVYRYGLMAVLLAIMAALLIWPIILTVRGGFYDPASGALTLRYLGEALSDPLWQAGLMNSLLIALCTTLLCVAVTLPLALVSARYEFPFKRILTSLLLVPLVLPPFVGAIGMRAILGRFGAINSLLATIGILDPNEPGIDFLGGALPGSVGRITGIVVMEVLHLYPILYLNVTAALANLDPALDEAAEGIGAGRARRFFGITLPLILPGLFAGATIVFIWSFTELGTPLMFDYYAVTPVQIFWGVQEAEANPRPYALVVIMLTVAVACYLLGKLALGGRSYAMQSKASMVATPKRLTGWRGGAAAAGVATLIALAILPHLGVVLSSFTLDGAWYRTILPSRWTIAHYEEALSHPLAMGSIRNSLMYASVAMVFAVLLGLAISYLTVRAKVRGGWLLDSLAMLPLAVPGLVMAFGYVAMSLQWPFKGDLFTVDSLAPGSAPNPLTAALRWLNHEPLSAFQILGAAPNPVLLLVAAYAIRRIPYVVRSASAGLEQTSGQLEEAALNLGASPMMAIRKIVIPLIMANLIAGGILAFSFAMLEVSDSLLLAQKEQAFPITKAIFDLFLRLGDGPYIASAMGVWAMALLTVTLIGASVLLGKKMGAIFRA